MRRRRLSGCIRRIAVGMTAVMLSVLMPLYFVSPEYSSSPVSFSPAAAEAAVDDALSSPDVVSAYVTDSTLYSFFTIPDAYADLLPQVSVSSTLFAGSDSGTPAMCTESETSVSYLLLIDDSTSMPVYKQSVLSFAKNLIDSGSGDVKVTVASYGASFDVLAEDLTTRSAVVSIISSMKYSQNASDISGGVVDALAYLAEKERDPGELVHLVLLTDGEPYIEDGGSDEEALSSAAEEAADAIAGSPETIVHSVCFGEWEETTEEAVTAGTGEHLEVSGSSEAAQAGETLAAYTDALYTLALSVQQSEQTARFDVEYRFSYAGYGEAASAYSMTISTVSDVADLALLGTDAQDTEESDESALEPPESTADDENSSEEDSGSETEEEEPAEVPAAEDAETADASQTIVISGDAAQDSADGEDSSDDGSRGLPFWIIAAGILLAVIVIVLVILLVLRRSRSAGAHGDKTDAPGSGQAAGASYEAEASTGAGASSAADRSSEASASSAADRSSGASAADRSSEAALSSVLSAAAAGKHAGSGVSSNAASNGFAAGIRMKAELLDGSDIGGIRMLSLRDEIVIGSDAGCDLVLTGEGIAARNTRIYLRGGMIYIEDLNEVSTTALGGMKLYAPNRLRSGDEITVGSVSFRLRF